MADVVVCILQARERQTWLSRALNPASLLPGLIIGFLLGLWVEVPKGGFSKGFSRQDPDPPDKLRKGSKSRGRQGSGSSSSGSGEVGGDLKMVLDFAFWTSHGLVQPGS